MKRKNELEQLKIEAQKIQGKLQVDEKERTFRMELEEQQTKVQAQKLETKFLGIIKHLIALDSLGNKKKL